MKLGKYIGDKAFYRSVLTIAVPIMIQNGITNFVSLLDNLMVGSIGTEAMSGISIVNQFVFIFYLLGFGALSAAGIFGAQFYGKGDTDGIRYCFRFKLMISVLIGLIGIAVFLLFDDELIRLFLHESESSAGIDLELTLSYGKEYLKITLIGLVPYVISQAFASTMRETGSTVVPMMASVAAVLTNLLFNTLLIFGYLGFPALGVAGAAIATVISRFVELAIILIYAYTHTKKYAYLVGALRSFRIPKKLLSGIVIKGLPIIANEFFWSLAMTLRNQTYSTRGLDVVAAMNIHTTLFNLCNVVYLSLGTAVSVIIGSLLGAGRIEEAKDQDRKMLAFAVMLATAMMGIYIGISFIYPSLYNTTNEVRELARYMMIVAAVTMPLLAFNHSTYFTIRAGGRTVTTVILDAGFMWAIVMPVCLIIAHLTSLNIYIMFAICQGLEVIKTIVGALLLKYGKWANQLVCDEELTA